MLCPEMKYTTSEWIAAIEERVIIVMSYGCHIARGLRKVVPSLSDRHASVERYLLEQRSSVL